MTFEFDLYAPALYLKNTSGNFICDIIIEPLDINVALGGRQRLHIEFSAIVRLSINEPLPLNPPISNTQ